MDMNVLMPQLRIEGLDPNTLLTKVQDTDANGAPIESLFMRYRASMAWFLTIYPDGSFNHTITVSPQKATATASIYRRQSDARPAAMATVTRYYSDTPDGRCYEQNAVTAAYRKALEYLGFGTPIDAHEVPGIEVISRENVPEMTDGGIPLPSPAIPTETPAQPVPATLTQKAVETVAPVSESPVTSPEKPAPAKKSQTAVVSKQVGMSQAPQAPAPASSEKVPTTYEEALQIRMPYGTNKGQTLQQIVAEKGDKADGFIRWHANKIAMSAPNSPFAAATQIYCEQRGC